MTLNEIYNQAKRLTMEEQEELASLLLEDVAPKPPNDVRDREHLIQLLLQGLEGEPQTVTDATWTRRIQRVLDRSTVAE